MSGSPEPHSLPVTPERRAGGNRRIHRKRRGRPPAAHRSRRRRLRPPDDLQARRASGRAPGLKTRFSTRSTGSARRTQRSPTMTSMQSCATSRSRRERKAASAARAETPGRDRRQDRTRERLGELIQSLVRRRVDGSTASLAFRASSAPVRSEHAGSGRNFHCPRDRLVEGGVLEGEGRNSHQPPRPGREVCLLAREPGAVLEEANQRSARKTT